MPSSSATSRRVYESPDLTFIDQKTQTQKNIPPFLGEIHRHVSALSDKPVFSYLDELFGTAHRQNDVFFDPPPNHQQQANACFRSGIIPSFSFENIDDVLLEKLEFVVLQEELANLEKNFQAIRTFILRFCKG